MIIGFLFLLLSIAVDCVKIKKDRGNCSTLECPWSSSCVNGKCEKLARLPCDWQTKCPAELPVCWRNLCAATKHTFLSCENINEIDLASFVPMAVGRHKAAFGGTIGDGDDALAVVVKSVVEPTARRRQMFLRSAIEELDVLTDLGDAAQEFLPRYYGGCLRDDQLFPVTVHEYLPICFDTLLQLNVPWCTRLALAIRIFKLLAYFSRTRNGAAVLCDLKIDQICFDKTLTPKLVDLNQIHVNVTDDRPFNGGTKCKFAASDGGSDNRKTTVTNAADNPNNNVVASNASAAADDDDNKNYDDDDDNSADVDDDFDNAKRQCFTKCFTSFHRDFPDLIMDEEICQKNNRCPGYTFASNVFVYCHLIFKPLLSLPDLPNSTLAVIQSTFEQCSSRNPSERETSYKFLKEILPILDSKIYMECSLSRHSLLLSQVLQAHPLSTAIAARGRARPPTATPFRFLPFPAHLDSHFEIDKAAKTTLRNFSVLVNTTVCVIFVGVHTSYSYRSLE